MKVISLICMSVVLFSCATKSDKKPIEDSKNNPAKSYEKKKAWVVKMIARHNEFDQETKDKLQKSLIATLDRARDLKKRESQLIQEVLKQSLIEKASYNKMLALKKELKKLYMTKYSNFEKAINELKKVIGIKPLNQSLLLELRSEQFFGR